MSKQNLEVYIKEALADKAGEIEPCEDSFQNLKNRLHTCIKGTKTGPRFWSGDRVMLRKVLIPVGVFLLVFVACSVFHADVKMMAKNMYNSIKTIFVVEGPGDDYQIVEKSTDEVLFFSGVGFTTYLSDEEISKKVRFRVSFPALLTDGFVKGYKDLGVSLLKRVTYNQSLELQNTLRRAIDDEREFDRLRPYEPRRWVSCDYRNNRGIKVTITIHMCHPELKTISDHTEVETPIGAIMGIWYGNNQPKYPTMQRSGIGWSDMTQKPVSVKTAHSLLWKENGLNYSMVFETGNELSREEAAKVAESFMKAQAINP